jgi:hypothetical protein
MRKLINDLGGQLANLGGQLAKSTEHCPYGDVIICDNLTMLR